MQAYGNGADSSLIGLFTPEADSDDDWIITANFEKADYIKDDDARNWDVKELLQSLRDGTESQNEERRSRGIPELQVDGWVQQPKYDSATQRLVWSVSGHDKGQPITGDATVNYNTYALGRDGYITLDLLTSKDLVEAQKPALLALLDNLTFNDGKRYADFNSSTDKIAEYGLAALVAGVAAKKLGLVAVVLAFIASSARSPCWQRPRAAALSSRSLAARIGLIPLVKLLFLLFAGLKYLKFGKVLLTGGTLRT
jgi:uncharacterized membrane-anchored protein